MAKPYTVSRLTAVLLILCIIFAGLAAWGWTRPPEVREVEKRVEVPISLVDLAKREGVLTIYGVLDTPDFEKVIKPEFLKLYPWAKVEYVGLSPGEIASRAISEFKAGKVTADILINTLGPQVTVVLAGAAEKVDNPMAMLMDYPRGSFDPQGYWHVGYSLPIVLIYNAKLVKPEDVPRTYEDLANPKWKGRIAIDRPAILNVAGSLFAHLYVEMGKEKWEPLMKAIAANKPLITESASDSYSMVAVGEALIGLGLINDYLSGKAKGVPVEMVWIKPATALYMPVIVTKNAPHPHMARLFLEWFTSASGQMSIAKTGRIPAHPAIASYTVLATFPPPPDVSIVAVAGNNPDYYANPAKWTDLFKSIFG